jgi:arabinogalactan oligomer/maltooligosaccharide transport system permease protein
LVLSDQDLITVGVKAYSLGTQGMDESLMGLMFIAIPPILFFVFFQKYIMHGMSAGGVKG